MKPIDRLRLATRSGLFSQEEAHQYLDKLASMPLEELLSELVRVAGALVLKNALNRPGAEAPYHRDFMAEVERIEFVAFILAEVAPGRARKQEKGTAH